MLDNELCFLITVYDEWELTKRNVSDTHKYHPSAQVIVLSDGTCPISNSLELISKERLKLPDSGGTWVHNYLATFLSESDKPYLIKIDPDTKLHRAIRVIPKSYDVWGYIHTHSSGRPVIESNSIGLTRTAVSTIVESNYLLEPYYNEDNPITYLPLSKLGDSTPRASLRVPMTDWMLLDVLMRLRLSIGPWPEACCIKALATNPMREYALTHPHTLIEN